MYIFQWKYNKWNAIKVSFCCSFWSTYPRRWKSKLHELLSSMSVLRIRCENNCEKNYQSKISVIKIISRIMQYNPLCLFSFLYFREKTWHFLILANCDNLKPILYFDYIIYLYSLSSQIQHKYFNWNNMYWIVLVLIAWLYISGNPIMRCNMWAFVMFIKINVVHFNTTPIIFTV